MTHRFVYAILFGLLAGVSLPLHGAVFDFRPPTPRERKVLDKYSRVINNVLAQFKDETWQENVDHSLANVEVDPNSEFPLHVNTFVQRTYLVRDNSQRYKELVLPLVRKMVLSSDLDEKRELNDQIQDLTRIQVQVRFNQPHIAVTPKPEDNHDLHIPGTALAYKIDDARFFPDRAMCCYSAMRERSPGTRTTTGSTTGLCPAQTLPRWKMSNF